MEVHFIVHIFTLVKHFPWIYTKKDDPKSLMRLARSTDIGRRCLGVKALAKHHDWEGRYKPLLLSNISYQFFY